MMNFLFLAGEATAQGSLLTMVLPILLVFVVFYFFLIRPEKKRKKEVTSMRESLKVGDTVTTIGGIVGRVVKVSGKDETVTIETGADKTKLRIMRWAIGSKEEKDKDKDKAAQAQDEKELDAPAEEEKKD